MHFIMYNFKFLNSLSHTCSHTHKQNHSFYSCGKIALNKLCSICLLISSSVAGFLSLDLYICIIGYITLVSIHFFSCIILYDYFMFLFFSFLFKIGHIIVGTQLYSFLIMASSSHQVASSILLSQGTKRRP